jgi:hypothetical protein
MERPRQGQSKQESERQIETEQELCDPPLLSGMTQKGWIRQRQVKDRPMEPVRQVPLPMQSLFTLLLIYIFVDFLGGASSRFNSDSTGPTHAYVCMQHCVNTLLAHE